MQDFSFKRDFKYVMWPQTLLLNFVRATVAGLIWFALSGGETTMLLLPFIYLVIFMPVGILCAFLSSIGVPWIGLLSILVAIII